MLWTEDAELEVRRLFDEYRDMETGRSVGDGVGGQGLGGVSSKRTV